MGKITIRVDRENMRSAIGALEAALDYEGGWKDGIITTGDLAFYIDCRKPGRISVTQEPIQPGGRG